MPLSDPAPRKPLHDMWLRLTVDENFVVRGAEAVTDAGRFALCPAITPRFAMLEGLQIGSGWMRKVREVVGGVNGCTPIWSNCSGRWRRWSTRRSGRRARRRRMMARPRPSRGTSTAATRWRATARSCAKISPSGIPATNTKQRGGVQSLAADLK